MATSLPTATEASQLAPILTLVRSSLSTLDAEHRVLWASVDDLRVDVVVGAEHRQARTRGGAGEMATQTAVTLLGLLFAG